MYLFYEAPESERNFGTLMYMVINAEAREEDESYRSPVDLLFDDLERVDEDHIAVKNWKVLAPMERAVLPMARKPSEADRRQPI